MWVLVKKMLMFYPNFLNKLTFLSIETMMGNIFIQFSRPYLFDFS